MKMDADMSGVGELQTSLDEFRNAWAQTKEIVWIVGASADYAAAVEFGTDPHEITPDDSEVLHFSVDGQEVFTTHVDHPGTPAQPYLQPALDHTRMQLGAIAGSADSREEAMEKIARETERRASQIAPVDTGNLKASIGARNPTG